LKLNSEDLELCRNESGVCGGCWHFDSSIGPIVKAPRAETSTDCASNTTIEHVEYSCRQKSALSALSSTCS
jgi:hypothetical protein